MKQKRWVVTLMAPATLWLVLLFLVPMGTMFIFTFRAGSFGPQRDIFTLSHYRTLVGNLAYHRLLWESIVIAFIVSVVSIALAYPVAYFLTFHAGSLRLTLLLVLIVPAWTSFLLRVFAWKLILGSGGLLNSFLLSTGLIDEAVPILLYSRSAVIIALVYSYIPFVALPIFAALQRIDHTLMEAAADLGSSTRQTFLDVIFPLSLPGVTAGFFLVFIPTLGEYVTPLMLGGTQGLMYGNIIQSQFARALNWPLGSLMSFVMLLMTLAMMFVFLRLVRLDDLVGA